MIGWSVTPDAEPRNGRAVGEHAAVGGGQVVAGAVGQGAMPTTGAFRWVAHRPSREVALP